MAVPKKRITKRRQGNRRSQKHGKITTILQLSTCSNCSAKTFAHTVCNHCGFYKGKKIMSKLV